MSLFFGCTLLFLDEVLSCIKLCKEDEKYGNLNTNVNWVLPGDATVIVEQQLELVDHDGDKLHQLQLGEMLFPPNILLKMPYM